MLVQLRGFEIHSDDPRHRVVRTTQDLRAACEWLRHHALVAVDTETSGLAWHQHARICGISLAAWDGDAAQCFYLPIRHQTYEPQLPVDEVVREVRSILEDPRITKVLHNIKFDEHMFLRENIRIVGPRRDTMIEAQLYDENSSLALKNRAAADLGDGRAHVFESLLGKEVARLAAEAGVKVEEFRNRTGYARVPVMLCGLYACYDVEFTLRLARLYDERGVTTQYASIYATEMALTRVLTEMEEVGLPVSRDYFEWLAGETGMEMDRLRPDIFKAFGTEFSPDSDAEVRDLLVRHLRLEDKLWKTTKGGEWSVDSEVLEHFAPDHPGLKLLLDYRDASKIHGTYTTSILERIGEDGALHGSFKQVGTTTGRMASENPNLQNFAGDSDARAIAATGKKVEDGGRDPWSVKRGFINRAPDLQRVYCDYSQIELRVLAFLSGDPVMTDVYRQNGDIHERTSMEVFGVVDKATRRKAKVINFGLSYCLSEKGYAKQAKVSEEQAVDDMARFFTRYPRIGPFRDEFWRAARANNPPGFANMFGRPRRVPKLLSPQGFERGRAERQAIGSLVQGTAAELTKESLLRIWEWEQRNRAGIQLCSTIHDEISFDVPKTNTREVLAAVIPLMEHYPQFNPVPILTACEYSDTDWSEKKDFPEEWINHVWKFS